MLENTENTTLVMWVNVRNPKFSQSVRLSIVERESIVMMFVAVAHFLFLFFFRQCSMGGHPDHIIIIHNKISPRPTSLWPISMTICVCCVPPHSWGQTYFYHVFGSCYLQVLYTVLSPPHPSPTRPPAPPKWLDSSPTTTKNTGMATHNLRLACSSPLTTKLGGDDRIWSTKV